MSYYVTTTPAPPHTPHTHTHRSSTCRAAPWRSPTSPPLSRLRSTWWCPEPAVGSPAHLPAAACLPACSLPGCSVPRGAAAGLLGATRRWRCLPAGLRPSSHGRRQTVQLPNSALLRLMPTSRACLPTSTSTACPLPPAFPCLPRLPAEEADPVESAIPEQFVSRYRGGRWVTEPVSHSGG